MAIKVLVRKRAEAIVVYALFDLIDGIRHPLKTLKRLKENMRNVKKNIDHNAERRGLDQEP